MSSVFQAIARKSGNSLVITIPKGVAEGLDIKNGTVIRVKIEVQSEEE